MSLEVYKLFSNEIHFWLQSTVSHCKIEKHVTCAHFWNIVSVCTYMESSYTDHQRSCAWIWNIWRVCAQIWKIVTPWPFCVVGIVSIRSLEKKREGVCTNLEHGTQMCTKTESARNLNRFLEGSALVVCEKNFPQPHQSFWGNNILQLPFCDSTLWRCIFKKRAPLWVGFFLIQRGASSRSGRRISWHLSAARKIPPEEGNYAIAVFETP